MSHSSDKPRGPRRREEGFEVCNHTCQKCTNRRSRSILWAKEGSSCGRHARTSSLHPECRPPCPAASNLYTRSAALREYPKAIRDMLDAGRTSPSIDDFFSKHVANWRPGRQNWPKLPPSQYMQAFDSDQSSAGPSRVEDSEMEVDDEEEEDGEEEEEDQVKRLTIVPRHALSVAHASRAASSRYLLAARPSDFRTPDSLEPYPSALKLVEPHTYKLLYVPDASREHRTRDEALSDLAWVKRDLTKDQLEAIKDMKGSYYKVRSMEDDLATEGVTYWLTEWLWTIICLSEHKTKQGHNGFDVSYMLWSDFKETLIDPRNPANQTRWEFIRSHDIIIGGMDYTVGGCYDHPSSCYDLHGNARNVYEATLLILARVVKFWPPIPQVRTAAHKWLTTPILDMIAAANGWRRPKTTVLTPGGVIPTGTMLRRSHSNYGDFVILPPESVVGDGAVADKKRRQLEGHRSWSELKSRTSSGEQRWASQEYVETLKTLGEWRCFVLGGHIALVVHTIYKPDEHWEGKRVWQFKSLRQIRELWANRKSVPVTANVLVNPDSGDRLDRTEGWEDFRDFVDKTYKGLVTQESNPTGGKCSLTVFFRMDIGIIFDAEGNPSYFVNEIERTQTMSMWLKTVEDTTNRTMLDTFARILHTHMTELDDIYTY
ncbi:hypothetical protein JVT61DRAFT_8574 [Boletus reticuloceps]|uniref:Uncharacterized protein n=1 Tax=Boletus reticuloceps TaxID=495285 RepID=A0A8I3AFH3_9AGAM|nr:hypothetical protein JVT61DRAFT_8574 [Boletus reticuloceps]